MKFKMAAMAGLSLTLEPMEKMFQNASSFQRGSVLRHFSHRVQYQTKSWCSHHLPFYIGTKNLIFVEDHPMNIPV
jgi:hypothetical protein